MASATIDIQPGDTFRSECGNIFRVHRINAEVRQAIVARLHNAGRWDEGLTYCWPFEVFGPMERIADGEAQPIRPTFPGDTRFYPGYHWVYETDSKRGHCLPGSTPAEAIETWAAKYQRQYWQKRRTITLYSLAGPDAEPVEHRVEVGGTTR